MVTSSFLLKAADAKIEHYKWLDLLVLLPQSLWQLMLSKKREEFAGFC